MYSEPADRVRLGSSRSKESRVTGSFLGSIARMVAGTQVRITASRSTRPTQEDRMTHIGIDVSKDRLDIAVHESGETFDCHNRSQAFAGLIERLRGLSPTLIV